MTTERATLDTRPLFNDLRRYAYGLVHDYGDDEREAFEEALREEAVAWMHERGRQNGPDSRPPEGGWTDRDEHKAVLTAESVAAWTWERLRDGETKGV